MDRANDLVNVVGDARITTIYRSDTLRSSQTVEPLASHLGLTPVNYSYASSSNCPPYQIDDITNDVLRNHKGETVLIAAHSGTINTIIHDFGGPANSCPVDGKFDNLCILTVGCDGKTGVIRARYGAVS